MRIHALSMSGFGPFAGDVDIDFDALAGDGLFLIAGPTGAGKTSILDALTFGLFGTVPGARGAAAQLRSQFAAPDAPTQVTVEFSARGRRWRVERSPAYQRPSRRRGHGLVTERARAQLLVLDDGEWAGRGRTIAEVQSEIAAAVGLSAAQFTKIVLLPQGDFAAFLRADPKDREPIMRRLFGTERFTAVEAILQERASAARKRLAQVSERRRFIVEESLRVHGEDLATPADEHPSVRAVDCVLGPGVALLREQHEVAAVREAIAEELSRAAQDARSASEERLENRRRHADYLRLKEECEDQAEERARLRETRATLEHAADLMPMHRELQATRRTEELSRERVEAAGTELAAACAAVPELGEPSDGKRTDGVPGGEATAGDSRTGGESTVDGDLKETDDLAEIGREVSGAGRTLAETLVEADRLDEEIARVRAEQQSYAARRDSLAEEARAAQEELARAESEIAAAVPLGAALQRAKEDAERARAAHQGALTLQGLRDELRVAVERARTREADEADARRTYEALREERIRGIASELAGELSAGVPCPVCGSEAHPAPASTSKDSPTRDAEKAAYPEWERRQRAAVEAGTARAELGARVDALAETADGAGPEAAGAQLAAAQETLHGIEAELARIETVRTEVERMRADTTRRGEERARLDTALERITNSLATAQGRRAQLDTGRSPEVLARFGIAVPETPDDARAIALIGKTLTDAAVASEDARRENAAAAAAMSQRRMAFSRRLADSPFADAQELFAAAAVDGAAVERRLAELTAKVERLSFLEESAWFPAAARDDADDERLHEEARRSADAAARWAGRARAAVEASGAARARLEEAGSARASFLTEAKEREPEHDALREDIAIAGIALATSGDNTRRMALSSYALVALFADVASNASERLLTMSRGRYALVLDDDLRRNDRRAGLGLAVTDAYTQERRDTRTLSGGESFMAALALALGLADTVRSSAGGIELDSLFIDEGFGTLDPDALEEVLGILDELRDGGRTIGLISHVQGMQSSIPNRITVRPSPTGSTIALEIEGHAGHH